MKNAMKSKMAILVIITYANGYLNILKKKKELVHYSVDIERVDVFSIRSTKSYLC